MSPKVKTSKDKMKDNAEKKGAVEIPQVALNYHKLSLEELARQFDTNILEGHNSSTANQLLLKNGPNKIKQKTENKFFKIVAYFLGGFGSLFLFAAIICILAWKPIGSIGGEIPDLTNLALGILLILVVIIQAGFNAFQDW
jgi:sodium/potassium-transporting ATPase subunit alpha